MLSTCCLVRAGWASGLRGSGSERGARFLGPFELLGQHRNYRSKRLDFFSSAFQIQFFLAQNLVEVPHVLNSHARQSIARWTRLQNWKGMGVEPGKPWGGAGETTSRVWPGGRWADERSLDYALLKLLELAKPASRPGIPSSIRFAGTMPPEPSVENPHFIALGQRSSSPTALHGAFNF